MPELSSEAQLVVIYALAQVILRLIDWFRGYTKDDAKADQTAAHERQQWMAMQKMMLETVLNDQHTKYAELVRDIQRRFDSVVTQVQENFRTALKELVGQVTVQMAPVLQLREQKLDAIHADVKIVPAEVWRLGDPRLTGLSDGVRTGLEPLIADLQDALEGGFRRIECGLAERLEALGEEMSPALCSMLAQELAQYQQRTQRQLETLKSLIEGLRDEMAREGRDGTEPHAGVPNETPDPASGERATPSELGIDQDYAERETAR